MIACSFYCLEGCQPASGQTNINQPATISLSNSFPELDASPSQLKDYPPDCKRYDRRLIDAITDKWYRILDSKPFATNFPDAKGKLVVQFRLNRDGSITNLIVLTNEVGKTFVAPCEEAITQSAPLRKWPRDMRKVVGNDYREIQLGFYFY